MIHRCDATTVSDVDTGTPFSLYLGCGVSVYIMDSERVTVLKKIDYRAVQASRIRFDSCDLVFKSYRVILGASMENFSFCARGLKTCNDLA